MRLAPEEAAKATRVIARKLLRVDIALLPQSAFTTVILTKVDPKVAD
jgi:hypothetical protein